MKNTDYSTPIPKHVFISRNLDNSSILKTELKRYGYEVFDESLITISQIRYSNAPKSDWIFFSSKNAMTHFFAQSPDIDTETKFAVLSHTSANFLTQFGKTACFVGEGNDVVKIAKHFAKLITTETVLFPQAIDSLQTIQSHIPFSNISKSIYVYKTDLRSNFEIPKSEILVFTSPSNVDAYHTKYTISTNQKVIAIGSSTTQKLKSYGIHHSILSESFLETGLLSAVLNSTPVGEEDGEAEMNTNL